MRRYSSSHADGAETRSVSAPSACELLSRQSEAACFAKADLRLAAWFLWMTPLLTALSSLRLAARSALWVVAASPEAAASRKERTNVFSSDFTALLRSRRFSFVVFRLIWDLMFATRDLFLMLGQVGEGVQHLRRMPAVGNAGWLAEGQGARTAWARTEAVA